jgi:hypothetical protein
VRERARAVRLLAVPCAIACVALAAAATVPAAGGCTTHQCDPSCVRIGAAPDPSCTGSNPGNSVHAYRNGDEIVWETSDSVFDPWLDYPGQRTYELNWQSTIRSDFPDVDLCTLHVVSVDSYISTDQNGINFVPAAGQLVETTYPLVVDDDAELPHDAGLDADGAATAGEQANGQVNVFNGTCAEYFLRVVVTLRVGAAYLGCHPSSDAAVDAGAPDARGEGGPEAG